MFPELEDQVMSAVGSVVSTVTQDIVVVLSTSAMVSVGFVAIPELDIMMPLCQGYINILQFLFGTESKNLALGFLR